MNQSLKAVGLGMLAQPWLGQSDTALGALIFVNAWHWVGFPTLIFLAGMQRIPPEILDAARMETESEWVRISKIVWPLVAPSATVVFILLFIGAWAVVHGLFEIVAAFRLRKVIENELLLGLAGVLSVAFGVMVAFRPAAGALAIVTLLGAFAIATGAVQVLLGLRLRGLRHRAG